MPSRGAARRAVRRAGGDLMRRFALLPEGTPDGLGEDRRLAGTRLQQQVMVFFPDTSTNLYQLRQWYGPLQVLDRTHPVVIVVCDSRLARLVRGQTALPVVTIGRSAALDGLLAGSQVKLALYVSQLSRNFMALRHTSLVHVYVGHGESDKASSASNQIKAYDRCFVAGQAAVDRIARETLLYDAGAHLVQVGRPQLDTLPATPAGEDTPGGGGADGDRRTVLYAPTWEGGQPSATYGSVASHGAPLVRALLDSGRYTVVYRPHPRTGANQAAYGEADAAIRDLVGSAARARPGDGHRVDTTADPQASMARADLLVSDISAVALDWLPSGKPLMVTIPAAPDARPTETDLLRVVPRLGVDDLGRVVDLVEEQLHRDPVGERRRELVSYYFGDTTPGTSISRFVEACSDTIALRDREVAQREIRREEAR